MFGLGIWEIVVILAVALIVLGPRRLPGMARQLGRALREFRRATNELRYSIDEATAEKRERPVPDPYDEPSEVVTSKPVARVGPTPANDEPDSEPEKDAPANGEPESEREPDDGRER